MLLRVGPARRCLVPLVLVSVLLGCASLSDYVRRRAAVEFSCSAREIVVDDLGAGALRARGCGRMATFVCTGHGGTRPLCVHDGPDGDAPRTNESMLRVVEAARPALDPCLPDGEPIRVRFTVDERGHVTAAEPATDVTDEVRWCVTHAFLDAAIEERADAARTVTVRVPRRADGAGVVAEPDVVTSPAPTGADASNPETAEAESALRARVDERRATILTCTGASSVALSIAYAASGDLTIALRGALAGGDEEECVRAALAGLRIDPAPGVAGSLIHAVTAAE